MSTVPAPVLIDRTDVHKSCKSLEAIVSVLANYTEAANALAAIQKKLARALREAASVKGTNSVSGEPFTSNLTVVSASIQGTIYAANAMVSSAGIFESLAEVDAKFAKIADKEAENVGSDLKKWFKKLAKEEKAHDERITNSNAKIKQAGQAYEKKAKRKDRDASDEHSRYVAILSSVGPEMSQDKYNHSLFVTQRHTLAISGVSASLARLAEAEWGCACENVRRCALSIGSVSEWRALCEGGWSGPVPGDLPDLGTVQYEGDQRNHDGIEKTRDTMRALMLPQPTSIAAGPVTYTNEYPESPIAPLAPRPPPSIGRSSEAHSVAEQSNSNTMSSHPPSPPPTHEAILNVLKKQAPNSESANLSSPSMTETAGSSGSTAVTDSPVANLKPTIDTSLNTGLKPAVEHSNETRTSNDERGLLLPDQRSPVNEALETETRSGPKTNHQASPQDPPPPLSSRELFAGERDQPNISKKIVDFVDDRERDRKPVPPSPVRPSEDGRRANVGGDLDRRLSVESTMSANSLVATMRDRYDSRPVKPSSPPPRDLPRLHQSVTDLAIRYTPTDSQTSPRRANLAPSPQSGPPVERFPTFQDRYPRTTADRSEPDRGRYRIPPDSPGPDTDYFGDRDKDRYRYVDPPVVDRNRFLRDDRDRERYRITMQPRSPDRHHPDELGRQRRIDTVEEMALQEREEALREKERQLDLERARIASARERDTGYVSDTSTRDRTQYSGPVRSESPGPMTSQQSLRPPPPTDHAPNCGCQRCSARHYASSTPSLPRMRYDSHTGAEQQQQQPPIFKPDPPIKLRPEKPKNWIRRMSMPLVSSNDKKSLIVGQNDWASSMALPEEDGRIARRSFERDRETADRFGGTTRR